MTLPCKHCGSTRCRPKHFHLCALCEGKGCDVCKDSLVPGIIAGRGIEEETICICSDWGDPEIDALAFDTMESLKSNVIACRNNIMRENGI